MTSVSGIPGWPVRLTLGTMQLRPLTRRDRKAWVAARLDNEQWLRPWEASIVPSDVVGWAERHTSSTYRQLLHRQRAAARARTQLPLGVFVEDQLIGQVNIGEIVHGALCSGSIGYWIDQRFAGRGIVPVAVALIADHAFREAGLHRIEANVRPENVASTAVVSKLGFTDEGLRRRYLAIDGHWRDHISWALLIDDHPEGVLAALLQRRPAAADALVPSRHALSERPSLS